ncbi:ankryin [Candidatus Poribacteria bacterium]|nr:ankryin [Candidatus Poribacteria bacterium]MBT7098266.1 ankryin [Candidatus Poribacteria bacterium]
MQVTLAREHGFQSWAELKRHVELAADDPVVAFIEAACVPLDGGSHAAGALGPANTLLTNHPEIASSGIYTAAALGDAAAVRQSLADDPALATAKGGPRGWDPLTYLCFSHYLRLDAARSDGFIDTARVLIVGGADPNTGFFDDDHLPEPTLESVMYGAAGVANHAGVTRLLLEAGADPNDRETPYHAPEHADSAAMMALVESGKVDAWGMSTMLLRKLDFHDYDGVAWLLQHGADANDTESWGKTALHQAVLRRNALRFVDLLLEHGADPTVVASDGKSAVAVAARMGRADVIEGFAARGFSTELQGIDRFLAACARADAETARAIVAQQPSLLSTLRAEDGRVLADVAGSGNTEAVRLMLDLGFDIEAPADFGETALHLSIWHGRHETTRLLIERGAPLEQENDRGETALQHAVRAAAGSDWDAARSAEAVSALLDAGANVRAVTLFPSGVDAVDALLEARGLGG